MDNYKTYQGGYWTNKQHNNYCIVKPVPLPAFPSAVSNNPFEEIKLTSPETLKTNVPIYPTQSHHGIHGHSSRSDPPWQSHASSVGILGNLNTEHTGKKGSSFPPFEFSYQHRRLLPKASVPALPQAVSSGGKSDALVKLDATLTAGSCSITNTLPTHSPMVTCSSGPGGSRQSELFHDSHSFSSPSPIISAENKTVKRDSEDSLPDPVGALVLLFYRPPVDPDITSLLNVLLLPNNVVLQDVLHKRKKIVGDQCYIETPPHCKLHPQREYTLSTCPEDDSVLVEPIKAEFDRDNYKNLFPSFQVHLEKIFKHIKLCLRDTNSSQYVWERRVCLSSTGAKSSCWQSALNLPSNDRLLDIRSNFIARVSGPVLKCLLDKLFDKKVLNDSERETGDEMSIKEDKARCVIDMVRRKGEAASSEMIEALCEVDPFLSEHLGLM